MLELWYFICVILVIRAFRGYHYCLPCDLPNGVRGMQIEFNVIQLLKNKRIQCLHATNWIEDFKMWFFFFLHLIETSYHSVNKVPSLKITFTYVNICISRQCGMLWPTFWVININISTNRKAVDADAVLNRYINVVLITKDPWFQVRRIWYIHSKFR